MKRSRFSVHVSCPTFRIRNAQTQQFRLIDGDVAGQDIVIKRHLFQYLFAQRRDLLFVVGHRLTHHCQRVEGIGADFGEFDSDLLHRLFRISQIDIEGMAVGIPRIFRRVILKVLAHLAATALAGDGEFVVGGLLPLFVVVFQIVTFDRGQRVPITVGIYVVRVVGGIVAGVQFVGGQTGILQIIKAEIGLAVFKPFFQQQGHHGTVFGDHERVSFLRDVFAVRHRHKG